MVIDPDVENLTALGDAVLEVDGQKAAAAMFAKAVARFRHKAAVQLRVLVGSTRCRESRTGRSKIEGFKSAIADETVARAFDGRNEVWADGLSFANAFSLEVDRCVTSSQRSSALGQNTASSNCGPLNP